MQRNVDDRSASQPPAGKTADQGGCYGVQILVAGRRKPWRDAISAEVRQAGFSATNVDSAVDALTVLALGLPVDVMIADLELHGDLCRSRLAVEARSLRPNLRIILASDVAEDEAELVSDAYVLLPSTMDDGVASSLRDALAVPAA